MKKNDDDKVPLFRSWTGWYVFVLVVLVLLVILFYLMTQYFA
ncbi:MAG: hypothetical protein ABWZ25_01790 [Chitinophagaceae bacterium]